MKPNGFSAVPILDGDGRYVGVLSTSDLVWFFVETPAAWQQKARATPLLSVPRRRNGSAVHIDTSMPTLVEHAKEQSFVPVVDDREVFIGIVRRRSVMDHLSRLAERPSRSAGEWASRGSPSR